MHLAHVEWIGKVDSLWKWKTNSLLRVFLTGAQNNSQLFVHILCYIFATTRYTLHILYGARIPTVLAFLLQLFVCHLVETQPAMQVKRTMLYRFVSIFYVERRISYGLHRRTFDTMFSCIYRMCGPLCVISSALNQVLTWSICRVNCILRFILQWTAAKATSRPSQSSAMNASRSHALGVSLRFTQKSSQGIGLVSMACSILCGPSYGETMQA